MKQNILFTALVALALLASACGAATTPVPPPPAPPATDTLMPLVSTAAPATDTPLPPAVTGTAASVQASQNATLGSFLVDSNGMTLYLYTKDTPNTSNCYGGCAAAWPPLLTTGAPVASQGVNASFLGTTQRTDGTMQVTYNGWPLYYYAADKNPGDTNGEGVGGVWYVITPDGMQK